MNCTIDWNSLSLPAWQERWQSLHRANLLQSYEYAQGLAPLQGQRGLWGLIRIDGVEAGMVQILQASLFGKAIHTLALDRGPLWFEGFGTPTHIQSFFTELDRQFPRRFGRKRRILPEIADPALMPSGYKKTSYPPYETIWLDLTPSEEELRAGLKKNWRGSLKKAEKSPLRIEWDDPCAHLNWLISYYAADKATRGYHGPAPKIVRVLGKTFGAANQFMLGRAVLDQENVAGIMILCHGKGATYQIGWTSDKGRTHDAHHLLLWQGLCALKGRGICDFDLGGINEKYAAGVGKFKAGMGGEFVSLCGLYR